MTARALIAHGGPQRLPTRAAPSLVRALRDARGSPPWTPWTILCRLTGTILFCNLYSCRRRRSLRPSRRPNRPRHGVITITGIGDHLRPEWPITITGTRNPGYAVSGRVRKRIEEVFGWTKAAAGFRQTRHRGLARVGWMFALTVTAYNLVRLPKLVGAAA